MTDNVLAFLRAALPWVVMGLLLAVFFARNTGSKKKEKEPDDYGTEGIGMKRRWSKPKEWPQK